jgi:hypothetical protein
MYITTIYCYMRSLIFVHCGYKLCVTVVRMWGWVRFRVVRLLLYIYRVWSKSIASVTVYVFEMDL